MKLKMHFPAAADLEIDIEKYLIPFIPRSRLHLLPRPLSHFLGYRDSSSKRIGNLLIAGWSFVGAFCGVAIIEGVFMSPVIRAHGTPLIIGSFGAAAILEYNTIESPLAQPRNAIAGHFISTVAGVAITKLFELSPHFESLRWVAGAIACGLASAAMTLTKTIHPPAGATALLAAVDPIVSDLGWYLLPLVLLSAVLTVGSACLINNIQRQFPLYWVTPVDLSKGMSTDIERTPSVRQVPVHKDDTLGEDDVPEDRIVISAEHILVPNYLFLAAEEKGMLEILRHRLKQGLRPDQHQLTSSISTSSDRTAFSRSTH